MSHKSTIRTVDKIGAKHDATVILWKDQLQRILENQVLL